MSEHTLPKPPKFSLKLIGPGIVLIAMGLGSGEFVLWPYMASQFGLGILWGAVVGITFQYVISNESGRYTLATGDSVFAGLARVFKYFPYWFIISTFLSFAWPGIIGSGGKILAHLLDLSDYRLVTVLMLVAIGLILTFGGKVYANMKRVQKLFIAITLPILLLIFISLINPTVIGEIATGLIGLGTDYMFWPIGLGVGTFLGAIAYAGAGGNLVMSHSFYIQDEGMGMAKDKNSQIEIGKKSFFNPLGQMFEVSKDSYQSFKKWMSNTEIEQFITFWIIGLITIVVLSVIAYILTYPFNGSEGISFIFLEGERLVALGLPLFGLLLLVTGVVFLFTTQLGVFEATSRIMSENLLIISRKARGIGKSTVFFIFLWSQILFAIVITLLDIAAPIQILFINTFFSAISMFVASGAIYLLNTNKKIMPREIQPGITKKLAMIASFVFFGIFVAVTILEPLT